MWWMGEVGIRMKTYTQQAESCEHRRRSTAHGLDGSIDLDLPGSIDRFGRSKRTSNQRYACGSSQFDLPIGRSIRWLTGQWIKAPTGAHRSSRSRLALRMTTTDARCVSDGLYLPPPPPFLFDGRRRRPLRRSTLDRSARPRPPTAWHWIERADPIRFQSMSCYRGPRQHLSLCTSATHSVRSSKRQRRALSSSVGERRKRQGDPGPTGG